MQVIQMICSGIRSTPRRPRSAHDRIFIRRISDISLVVWSLGMLSPCAAVVVSATSQ